MQQASQEHFKSWLTECSLASKQLSDDEKEQIMTALKHGQSWLDSNPEATAEKIKEKQKEVEGICKPMMTSKKDLMQTLNHTAKSDRHSIFSW